MKLNECRRQNKTKAVSRLELCATMAYAIKSSHKSEELKQFAC